MRIFRLGIFSLGNAQVANNDEDKEDDEDVTKNCKQALQCFGKAL